VRNFRPLKESIDRRLAELLHAQDAFKREKAALREAKARAAASAQAKTIVQEVAAAVQQAAHGLIGTVVTRCLKSVGFGYDFELEFVGKRGKTEVIFWFIKDGVKHRPYDMVPGGALDIAAFGCRLVAVMTSLPPRRRVLFLDEPFKNVQGEPYRSNLPGMLAVLADEFGFQFFMIANTTAEVDLGEVIII
jgi:hypothetical protein